MNTGGIYVRCEIWARSKHTPKIYVEIVTFGSYSLTLFWFSVGHFMKFSCMSFLVKLKSNSFICTIPHSVVLLVALAVTLLPYLSLLFYENQKASTSQFYNSMFDQNLDVFQRYLLFKLTFIATLNYCRTGCEYARHWIAFNY